jgi:DNA-binding beta-propeller fold protein YncE
MFALIIAAAAAAPAATPLKFPGVEAPVIMDYLAADGDRVWAPAGNTGKVFVLEKGQFKSVDGFPTAKGRNDRLMGPSSVSVGKGAAYVGNRGDSKIWAIDSKSLEKKGSVAMPSTPDGVFYVGATDEVWVTTPRDNSIQIIDVKDVAAPKIVGKVSADGPEGYAVDEKKGVVYTNLEDKDATVAIDAKSRKIISTWEHTCGKDGPRGLALDAERGVLFVGCASQGILVLDAKTGAKKSRLEVGEGVDNIDYLPAKRLLYASAGRSEKLTVAHLEDDGSLKVVATSPVAKGCRVVVATHDGTAYAADSAGGQLWVLKP